MFRHFEFNNLNWSKRIVFRPNAVALNSIRFVVMENVIKVVVEIWNRATDESCDSHACKNLYVVRVFLYYSACRISFHSSSNPNITFSYMNLFSVSFAHTFLHEFSVWLIAVGAKPQIVNEIRCTIFTYSCCQIRHSFRRKVKKKTSEIEINIYLIYTWLRHTRPTLCCSDCMLYIRLSFNWRCKRIYVPGYWIVILACIESNCVA